MPGRGHYRKIQVCGGVEVITKQTSKNPLVQAKQDPDFFAERVVAAQSARDRWMAEARAHVDKI